MDIAELGIKVNDSDLNRVTGNLGKFEKAAKGAGRAGENVRLKGTSKLVRDSEVSSAAMRRLERSLAKTSAEVGLLSKSVSGLAGVFKHAFGGLIAFAAVGALSRFSRSLGEAQVEMQRILFTLSAVSGGMQNAKREFGFVSDISKELGLNLQETASGYSRLAASAYGAGLSTKQLHDGFQGLAEAFTVLHAPAEEVQRVLIQLDQGLSLGKIQMRDLRALSNSMPNVMELVQEAFRGTGQSIQDMLAHGGIPGEQFFERFTALLHDKYGPTAKEASKGISAELQRLGTVMFQLKTQSGFLDPFVEAIVSLRETLQKTDVQAQIAGIIKGMGDAFKSVISVLSVLIEHIGLLTTALKGLALVMGARLLGGLLVGAYTKMIPLITAVRSLGVVSGVATAATASLGAAMTALTTSTGIGAVIVLLGLFAKHAYDAYTNADKMRDEFEAYSKEAAASAESTRKFAEETRAASGTVGDFTLAMIDGGKSFAQVANQFDDASARMQAAYDDLAEKSKKLADTSTQLKDKQDELHSSMLKLSNGSSLVQKAFDLFDYYTTAKDVSELSYEQDKMNGILDDTTSAARDAAAAVEDYGAKIESAMIPALQRGATAAHGLLGGLVSSSSITGFFAIIQRNLDNLPKSAGMENLRSPVTRMKELTGAFNSTADQLVDAAARAKGGQAGLIQSTYDQIVALAKENPELNINIALLTQQKDNALAAAKATEKHSTKISEYAKLMEQIDKSTKDYQNTIDGLSKAEATHNERLEALNQLYQAHLISQSQLAAGVNAAAAEFVAANQAAHDYSDILEYTQLRVTGLTEDQANYVIELRRLKEQYDDMIASGHSAADAQNVLNVAAADAADKFQNSNKSMSTYDKLLKSMSGGTNRYRDGIVNLNQALSTYLKLIKEIQAAKDAGGISETQASDLTGVAGEGMLDALRSQVEQSKGMFDPLTLEADLLGKAIAGAFGEVTQKDIADFKDRLDQIHMTQIVDGAIDSLSAIRSMTKEGSKEYAALKIAGDALAVVKGVTAILNAGTNGDGYTAVARMAAVAAVVMPLLADIGQTISGVAGGGFSDTAASRQASQGTGSVLGDAEAKSESIANATEITANATKKLVAINTGMLRALQTLQQNIGGASGMLARGAGDATFNKGDYAVKSINEMGKLGGLSPLSGFGDIFNIFGGKSKITDTGIKIMGGALNDLINNIAVGAYAEIQSKSWAFGSTHTKEGFQKLDGGIATQFQLILKSIADTVTEGAKALGIPLEEIQQRIAAFQIATQNISLKGLSAEDQQKELEAVFSKIFDGLAESVVPFIGQFQKVGEGLGETLVRVATEVQVTQEAMRQLGLAIDTTDPEKFAQIADGLITMAGGVDNFITGMQSFVSAFAPEAVKFQQAQDALNMAFDQANLVLPDTRDGMWELMQSFDASTEVGQRNIAMLLRLTDVSDQYYDMQEKHAEELAKATYGYTSLVASLQAEAGMNPLAEKLLEIGRWALDTSDKLNDMAITMGKTGASAKDLALVQQVATARMQAAIGALYEASQSLVDQLYGTTNAASTASSAVSGFGNAMGDAAQKAKDSMALLLGDLSPYNDRQKLQMALEGQRAGTVTPQDVLQIGRRLYASGADYKQLFDQVMAIGDNTQAAKDSANIGRTANATSRLAEKTLSKAERYGMADQLANNIADLAEAQGLSFEEVADKLGLNLADLGKDLGLDNKALQDYLSVLASDNFGLQDLNGILAAQIDRLISAITGHAVAPLSNTYGLTDANATAPTGGTATLAPLAPASINNSKPLAADPAMLQRLDALAAGIKSLEAKFDENGKINGRYLPRIAENTERNADGTETVARNTHDLVAERPAEPRSTRSPRLPVGA